MDRAQLGARAADDRQVERIACQPPGSADSLDIGCDGLGQGSQHHRRQVPDVDAHFECRCRDEDIRSRGVVGSAFEPVFEGFAFVSVEHARVFAGDDPGHLRARVEVAVEVSSDCPRLQCAGTADEQAVRSVEVIQGPTGSGEDGSADRALEVPRLFSGIVEGTFESDPDRFDPVGSRLGVLDRHGPQNSSRGEPLQQKLGQTCAVVGGDAERPGRVPGVPALIRLDHVEERPAATADRLPGHPRNGEGRSIAIGGERWHALVAFPFSPDPDPLPALGNILLQPRMVDGPLRTQTFDDCPDPRNTSIRRGGSPVVIDVEQSRVCSSLVEHLGCDCVELVGLRQDDLGVDRPGGRQSAAISRLESEFERRVEGQALHHLLSRFSVRSLRLLPPRPHIGETVGGEFRRQRTVPFARVLACLRHDLSGHGFEGAHIPDGFGDDVPQSQDMGAGFDEPGPVCRVLDGIGEDERLLLMIVELLVAEESRQAHRQQRGHCRTEESDGIAFTACRAELPLRFLFGIRALEDEDGQDVTGAQSLGEVIGDRRRAVDAAGGDEVAFANVEGREVLVQFIRVSAGEVVAVGFATGADERTESGVPCRGLAPDVLIRIGGRELVADGGLDDPPTVATAVAAVDGGEALSGGVIVPAAGLTGDEVSVIGPGEFGFATGDPVDACQRPHPQVRVDRRSGQTLFGTDEAQSCDDVAEVALGCGAAGAEQFFPEVVEPDG